MVYIINRPDPDKPTPADLLHYGVKGMRWGVRRSDEELGRSRKAKGEADSKSSKSEIIKAAAKGQSETPKLSPDQKAKNLQEAKKDFNAKFEPSTAKTSKTFVREPEDGTKKGLSGKQKAAIALGAATVAYMIVDYKVQQKWYKELGDGQPIGDFKYGLGKSTKLIFSAGESVSPNDYMTLVKQSQGEIWGKGKLGYYTKGALEREDISLPAGHTFNRLSRAAEDSFSKNGTYSTIDMADFKRYIYGFGEMEKGGAAGLYHVTFNAKKDIKIASAATQVKAMQSYLNKSGEPSDALTALKTLSKRAGGGWYHDDKVVQGLFAELKSMGFSGIIDEMDAGVIGESPSVIFDTEAFGSKSSSKITTQQVIDWGTQLTEIANRKDREKG